MSTFRNLLMQAFPDKEIVLSGTVAIVKHNMGRGRYDYVTEVTFPAPFKTITSATLTLPSGEVWNLPNTSHDNDKDCAYRSELTLNGFNQRTGYEYVFMWGGAFTGTCTYCITGSPA